MSWSECQTEAATTTTTTTTTTTKTKDRVPIRHLALAYKLLDGKKR
jgi:hypothetical protein